MRSRPKAAHGGRRCRRRFGHRLGWPRTRGTGRWPARAFRLAALALAGALASAAAWPEVRLSTSVSLVRTVAAEDGASQRQQVDPDLVVPGDELRYAIRFANVGPLPVEGGAIVITNPIPEDIEYVFGSAGGRGARVLYAVDPDGDFAPLQELAVLEDGSARPAKAADVRALRWIYELTLAPGASSEVWFHAYLRSSDRQQQ